MVVNEQVEREAQAPALAVRPHWAALCEHPVANDAGVVTDRQLAALHKGDAGGLATVAMEQEGKGQQESRHQGHNPAAGGKLTTAVTELLLHPIGPEMLAVPVGAEMEQHHDEKHLAKGELARSLTLTA